VPTPNRRPPHAPSSRRPRQRAGGEAVLLVTLSRTRGQPKTSRSRQIADHGLCAVIGHGPSDGRADTARATHHERNCYLESRHQIPALVELSDSPGPRSLPFSADESTALKAPIDPLRTNRPEAAIGRASASTSTFVSSKPLSRRDARVSIGRSRKSERNSSSVRICPTISCTVRCAMIATPEVEYLSSGARSQVRPVTTMQSKEAAARGSARKRPNSPKSPL